MQVYAISLYVEGLKASRELGIRNRGTLFEGGGSGEYCDALLEGTFSKMLVLQLVRDIEGETFVEVRNFLVTTSLVVRLFPFPPLLWVLLSGLSSLVSCAPQVWDLLSDLSCIFATSSYARRSWCPFAPMLRCPSLHVILSVVSSTTTRRSVWQLEALIMNQQDPLWIQ